MENHNLNEKSQGTLYVVSTPIGNKKDITFRAADVLQNVDIVVGEEIKEASRVLMNLSLTKEIELLNEHNEAEKTHELYEYLKEGKSLALISDCGTPIFADPGLNLVKLCIQKGIEVVAVPGASSIMTALVTSGFTLKQFLYAGFLKRTGDERDDEILQLAKVRKTVVLMDTPYRLKVILEAFTGIIPNRRAYIGMNLTMPSETHHYGTFAELYEKFRTTKFKAEYILVFEGLDNTDKEEKARLSKMISIRKIYGVKASKVDLEDEEYGDEIEETDESGKKRIKREDIQVGRVDRHRESTRNDYGRPRRDRDEKGRSFEDKPKRRSSFDDDRPRRENSFDNDRPRRTGSFSDDKPRRGRSFDDDRPRRGSSSSDDRPRRGRSFDENKPRRENSFDNDRPRRTGSFSDDKPRRGRSFDDDKPRRRSSFEDDRPRRSESFGEDKPRFNDRKDRDNNSRPKRSGSGFSKDRSEFREKRTDSFGEKPKRERSGEDRPRFRDKNEGFSSRGDRRPKSGRPSSGKPRKGKSGGKTSGKPRRK